MDAKRATAFAGQMTGMLNHACLAILTSIGHRTGLYDTLAVLPPSSAEEIARAAGLSERYVREWLGAMVTGGIVDYDGRRGTYALPPEHATSLTSTAGLGDLAALAPQVSALACLEHAVVARFRRDHRPATATALDAVGARVLALLDPILLLVPGAREQLRAGARVAVTGPAAQHAIAALAAAFPTSHFLALPLAELAPRGDLQIVIAFDVLCQQADPVRAARSALNALCPGGSFLYVETASSSHLADNIDHPFGPTLYALATLMLLPASEPGSPGAPLGQERTGQLLAQAGFESAVCHRLAADPFHNYNIAIKPLTTRSLP